MCRNLVDSSPIGGTPAAAVGKAGQRDVGPLEAAMMARQKARSLEAAAAEFVLFCFFQICPHHACKDYGNLIGEKSSPIGLL